MVHARVAVLLALLVLPSCAVVQRVGVGILSKRASLSDDKIIRNTTYQTKGVVDDRHKLDLYIPHEGTNWPTLIFVHGGGWTEGNKDLVVGGLDVYGNIGRFYASRGIGVAVINYRLQPTVNWRQQVQDVATATAWVQSNVPMFEGDPDRLFLFGHSAGAHLASHVALDQELQKFAGIKPGTIKGLIAVSGAALDLLAEETYELGAEPWYYESRFGSRGDEVLWKAASPMYLGDKNDPPTLVLFSENETEPLKFQAAHFAQGLRERGMAVELLPIDGASHGRIVLMLSHPRKLAAKAILGFAEGKRMIPLTPPPPPEKKEDEG